MLPPKPNTEGTGYLRQGRVESFLQWFIRTRFDNWVFGFVDSIGREDRSWCYLRTVGALFYLDRGGTLLSGTDRS